MQAWFNAYKHMKIKTKLTFLITFIIALTFAFTTIVQQYAFYLYEEQLYEKSSQVLNLSSSAIETELNRLEQISYNMITDIQFQNLLLSIKNSETDYDRLILRQLVLDRLFYFAGPESSIISMQLFDSRGTEHDAGNLITFSPIKKARMMQLAREREGDTSWIFPDEEDNALILTREIRSFRNTNFDLQYLGTIVARINMNEVVRKMALDSAEGNLMIVAGSELVFPSNAMFDPTEIIHSTSQSTGYFTKTLDDKSQFVSYNQSSKTGWTYINITEYNKIFKHILFIRELVIAVFAFIFVLVVFLGIRFSRSLTKPIEDLMARMKMAEKGNFAEANLHLPEQQSMAMNEIGLLHRTFRIMVERINSLITESYANRLLLKETEFKALQAQINPHFLYNTLESINWLARVNKQTQISHMVESLGFLLSHSIELKEPILPLSEELEIIKSYVTIQKYRFEERLIFQLDVPDRYLNRRVPKLSLQPLLENAIQYALEPGIGACTISIRARETNEGFFLTVEDNGPGMAANTLEQLRKGGLKTNGKGIGLLNIDERIKIAFGESCGLRIDSKIGHGTKITLMLPGETEELNHVQSAASG
ncbi:cache domain-containing sensor histidine kinase [Paenibacillus luteus]|uniref:cache domain-containing sensor histidine kinase n=1 Tax=Paenibacillus luteus TaxID=2545753 RepID=UPI00114197E3|nr:sensor histidine kinase [Paenibacillus luteus]